MASNPRAILTGKSSTLEACEQPSPPQRSDDQPPDYKEETDDVSDQNIGPIALVLTNHHVVVDSVSDHNPQPLYELNRGVATLSSSTTTVTFSRLDHAVRQRTGGDPIVKERKRHLYDLEHTKGPLFAKYALDQTHLRGHDAANFRDYPPFWCKSVSRRTVGDVGLKIDHKAFHARSTLKAWKVQRESGMGKYGDPIYVKSKKGCEDPIMLERGWDKKNNVYAWKNSAGLETAVDKFVDGRHKLEVLREVTRKELDILVAMWCLNIWHDSAIQQKNQKEASITFWEDVRRKWNLAGGRDV